MPVRSKKSSAKACVYRPYPFRMDIPVITEFAKMRTLIFLKDRVYLIGNK